MMIENPESRRRNSSAKARDRSEIAMKTENHFKVCLEREKRKNTELKGLIGKLQAKNKEIGRIVSDARGIKAGGFQTDREREF